MSDLAAARPAFGAWEFDSIAQGIWIADQIAKGTPVPAIITGTVHPGKYLVAVSGDPATVSVARDIVSDARPDSLVDSLYLADLAEEVISVIGTGHLPLPDSVESVGVVETATVIAGIAAADAAVKDATVTLTGLVLGDGLGGKAFFVLAGAVGDVTSSVAAADSAAGDRLMRSVVIPQVTNEMRDDLSTGWSFGSAVGGGS